MRRPPALLWLCLPAIAGVAYALSWRLWAPSADLAVLPPAEAVVTMRFRDTVAMDRFAIGYQPGTEGTRSQRLARHVNVPGLEGVDRSEPVHVISLPFSGASNRNLVVFGVEDGGAFREAFEDPGLFERGYMRRAQHAHVQGRWAAVSGQRDAVRRLGTGGVTARTRAEAAALAADVPRLVEEVLRLPVFPLWLDEPSSPWPGLLEALGIRGPQLLEQREASPADRLEQPAFVRLARIARGWRTARAWIFDHPARVEIELEPADAMLAASLERAARTPPREDAAPPDPRTLQARAWAAVSDPPALRALLLSLHHLGAPGPRTEGEGLAPLLEALESPAGPGEGTGGGGGTGAGLLLIGTKVDEAPYALTYTLVAAPQVVEAIGPWLPGEALGEAPASLPAGALPVTVIQGRRKSPVGELRRGSLEHRGRRFEVLSLGGSAAEAIRVVPTRLGATPATVDFPATVSSNAHAGWRPLARAQLDARTAERIFGHAFGAGHLLYALAAARNEGLSLSVATDGRRLRLVLEPSG